MHIAIYEEDHAMGRFLQRVLRSDNYNVAVSMQFSETEKRVVHHLPDLLLLGIRALDDTGANILRQMRLLYRNTRILALISHEAPQERARSLDLGADDCMTKPINCKELVARCRTLLRSRTGTIETSLSFGDLTIDRIARKVTRCGSALDLTSTEFALLEFLVQRPGQCCTRGEILQEVFQLTPSSKTNIINVYVSHLRKKLSSETAGAYRGLETLRGMGYQICDAGENSRLSVRENRIHPSVMSDA